MTVQSGEQYSIKLQMKALSVDRSSGVPKKDFEQWKLPSWQLVLEANFEMWFAQEISWQIVRPFGEFQVFYRQHEGQ